MTAISLAGFSGATYSASGESFDYLHFSFSSFGLLPGPVLLILRDDVYSYPAHLVAASFAIQPASRGRRAAERRFAQATPRGRPGPQSPRHGHGPGRHDDDQHVSTGHRRPASLARDAKDLRQSAG